MKNCSQCNELVKKGTSFCPTCGQDLRTNDIIKPTGNGNLLVVLCILTIVGSLFTIGRALLYEMFSEFDQSNDYIRGWIYAVSAIGTIVGAILMLQRKLNGLYIYTVFQVIYLITVLIASFSYGEYNDLAFIVALFFLVPSIVFLILYWTSSIKNNLN